MDAHSRNLRRGLLRNESRINRFLPFVFGASSLELILSRVILGLQLLSLQKLSLDILNYLGFEKLTGSRDQCPRAATKH